MDRVVIKPDDPLSDAEKHLLFGVGTIRDALQFDIESRFSQVSESFREFCGKINLFFDTADHNRDFFAGDNAGGAKEAAVDHDYS